MDILHTIYPLFTQPSIESILTIYLLLLLNVVKERPLLWKETHFTGTLWTHRFAVWQIAWHGIEFKRGHQYLVCKKYYNFLLFKAAKEKLSLKVIFYPNFKILIA